MASVFSHPSAGRVPASVVDAVTRFAKTVSVGRVRTSKGRLLLSKLGPDRRSIYAFPTTKGAVCFNVTGIVEGSCMRAFRVGEPAALVGAIFYDPGGDHAELAGITKDGVRRVQVLVHGRPHAAVFGHDAWYYRLPRGLPMAAAKKLIVTLKNGSTKTVRLNS
jgi:hypothetical protein